MKNQLLLLGIILLGITACGNTIIVYDTYLAASYPGNIKQETKRILADLQGDDPDAPQFALRGLLLRSASNLLHPFQKMALHHSKEVLFFPSYQLQIDAELKRFQPRNQAQYVHIRLARESDSPLGAFPQDDSDATMPDESATLSSEPVDQENKLLRQTLILDRRNALQEMVDYILREDEQTDSSEEKEVVIFHARGTLTTEEYAVLSDGLLNDAAVAVRELVYFDEETIITRVVEDIGKHRDADYFLFFLGSHIGTVYESISGLNGEICIESFFVDGAEYLGATMSIGFRLEDIISYSVTRDKTKDRVYVPAVFHRY